MIPVLLVLAMLPIDAGYVSPGVAHTPRPAIETRLATIGAAAGRTPPAAHNARSGVATWFRAPAATAAAGPALRAALGRWRGRWVTVTSGSRSVRVALRDFCACGPRRGRPTLLDLDARSFSRLAPLSRGVIAVTVRW